MDVHGKAAFGTGSDTKPFSLKVNLYIFFANILEIRFLEIRPKIYPKVPEIKCPAALARMNACLDLFDFLYDHKHKRKT